MQILTCGVKISTSITSSREYNLKNEVKNDLKTSKNDGQTHPGPDVSSSITPLAHCFHPSLNKNNHNDIKMNIISSRFFTSTRIPCMSLGFFLGQVVYVYVCIFNITVHLSVHEFMH
jgi:hypothetical protein